jgi:hypothetical protein
MFKTSGYREQAAEIAELIKTTTDPATASEFQKRKRTLNDLADNEQWVVDNHDKTVHAPDRQSIGGVDISANEQHVLQRLGAAVIMQWNALPTKLQRELFDNAGAVGELNDTAALRGMIARFLHNHKDGDCQFIANLPPRPGLWAPL